MEYRIGQRVRAKRSIRDKDKDGNRIVVAYAKDEGVILAVVEEGRVFTVVFDPLESEVTGLDPSKGNVVNVKREDLILVASSMPSRESKLSQAVRLLDDYGKHQQYPWSCLSERQTKLLLTHGTPSEAVEEALALVEGEEADQLHGLSKLFHATAVWGRGSRRLVRVSKKSQEILCDLAGERAAQGFRICYWHFLSAMGASPGTNEVGFGEGIMFLWEDDENEFITFGAPRGVFGDEYLEYGSFTYGSDGWRIGRMPLFLNGQHFEDKFAESIVETEKAGATRVEAISSLLYSDYFRLVHMTVNLLHALHNFTPLVCGEKKRHDRRREEKEVSKDPGCERLVSINIEESGLSTWAETWCYEELDREEERIQLGKERRFGSPVSAYGRKGHMWKPWILPTNIRRGEKRLGTKRGQKKSDGTHNDLWQVRRARQGCWIPGDGKIKPKISRVKSGPDDLNVRTRPKTILRKNGGK